MDLDNRLADSKKSKVNVHLRFLGTWMMYIHQGNIYLYHKHFTKFASKLHTNILILFECQENTHNQET